MKIRDIILKLLFGLIILIIIFASLRLHKTKLETSMNNSMRNSNNINSLSLSPQLFNEINNKLILRLKTDYCEACVLSLLLELDKNTLLNNGNFIIITQFNDNRMSKVFSQYTHHRVINYYEKILPLDTTLKSNAYFIYIKTPLKFTIKEYYKGNSYQDYINKTLRN
jgi:hypothetical protein